MAAQQVQIAETIRAMKIAFRRKPDDSDSDDDYSAQTNRGNKLKRSARYVREGKLDTTGRLAYKRRIDHAGYTRAIISTNPPLYDSEGEAASSILDSDEDRPVHRQFYVDSDNPYGGIQLENLLKPLTSLEELADHPSLSAAYHDKALTQLAEETAAMLRVERENLWRAKRLLKRFEGDVDWVPCESFEAGTDVNLLYENGSMEVDGASVGTKELVDVPVSIQNGIEPEMMLENGIHSEDMAIENADNAEAVPGDVEVRDAVVDGNDHSETASTSASNLHAMTTRARAKSPDASGFMSPSPSDSASVPAINPWFIAPTTSIPDRDLGLPADEAETTRKMLLLYCQKQDQVIRSLDTLYSGLQKGDRLRHFILASAKASGHLVLDAKHGMVTEMSDGEDWYDPEAYGRLEKGKDEVEDIEEEGRRGGRRRRVVGRV